MNNRKKAQYFGELILKFTEGTINDEELQHFKAELNNNPEARRYYIESRCIQSLFFGRRSVRIPEPFISSEMELTDQDLYKLAAYEKIAPEAELPDEQPQSRELIQKVVYPPRENRKLSPAKTIVLAMSAAALLFFALLQLFIPPKSNQQVAILTDVLQAEWANGEMVKGTPILTGQGELTLRKGYAELLFANQAAVTIEGPAELEVVSGDQVKLNYGRLYATVPPAAIGFSVKTPAAQIIDLGTEFGVDLDLQGRTDLHVMKGKTVLIAGEESSKASIEVTEGFARRVSGQTHAISDIACDDRLFVRGVDSESNFIWRGENEICLADIIGGGDGFGQIDQLVGLDPTTGNYALTGDGRDPLGSENEYNLVPDCQFIDGVFVADGGPDGKAVITSLGDTFKCPDTTGLMTNGILVYRENIEQLDNPVPPAIFDGQKFEDTPIVMIHSNAGITVDLQAVRRSLPGLNVTNFKAVGGLSDALGHIETAKVAVPDVDVFVLVDGQMQFEKRELTLNDNKVAFDIELSPHARFLTLVVTDGSTSNDAPTGYEAWNNDYFYLIESKLGIETSR